MEIAYQHIPVMAAESAQYLNLSAGKIIVDATLGAGGHAEKLKSQNSKVKIIGFDQDEEAIRTARANLIEFKDIEYVNDNFVNLKKHVKEPVDGILFDLGVSSYQIDSPERGFSLQKDGPLDMRMDQRQKLTAEQIVNHASEDELKKIFYEYGEERFSKRISKAICVIRRAYRQAGNTKMINTTFQLKEIVERAIPTWKKRESVTRIFQALRIAVNGELEKLKTALSDGIGLLKPGGRMVVISYHSLEDRMVKQTFREAQKNAILRIMTKKPILPGEKETAANPRARSAKLRAAEKI